MALVKEYYSRRCRYYVKALQNRPRRRRRRQRQ